MAKKKEDIHWLAEPEEHDYPAAESYLNLIYESAVVSDYVNQLRAAPILEFKAKDIFRAFGLSLLGVSNTHVEKDQNKIEEGRALSPLLLVQDKLQGKLVIADGYQRLCAIYSYDEDAMILCKIV